MHRTAGKDHCEQTYKYICSLSNERTFKHFFIVNKSQVSNKPLTCFMTYNTSVASAISSNTLIFNYMRWTQKDRKKI